MLQQWLVTIHQGGFLAAGIGFVLIVVVSFFPVLPIPVIAAAVGAVIPLPFAVAVTWSSATVGAILKFYLTRILFQRHAQKFIHNKQRIAAMVRFVEAYGFSAIVIARAIPVFPSSVINIAASITQIKSSTFVLATAVGKLAPMLLFTVAGRGVARHLWVTLAVVVLYVLVTGGIGWSLMTKRSTSLESK